VCQEIDMTMTDCVPVALLAALATLAGGLGSMSASASDARPMADERCVAKCDDESDRCMATADSEQKAKACDDKYSECLKTCR